MASFKDLSGRNWCVDLDLPTADRIKQDTGIDLIDPEKWTENLIGLETGGPALLVTILGIIAEEQANKLKLSAEEFAKIFKPSVVIEARLSLREAIIDFFRLWSPSKADGLRLLLEQAEAAADKTERMSLAELQEQLERVVLAMTCENSAGSTPASSESTPSSAA